MLEKKVDGRKFNGGNKGCGRKSKSDERQLVENLHHLKMKHLLYYSKKVLEGDKDMLKLYMSYMYGNPKVSTSKYNDSINS
jgi:hypothetical protein